MELSGDLVIINPVTSQIALNSVDNAVFQSFITTPSGTLPATNSFATTGINDNIPGPLFLADHRHAINISAATATQIDTDHLIATLYGAAANYSGL